MSSLPTMAAAVLTAPGQISIEQVDLPEPDTGEVRIKVEGCGVCSSNLPPWEGRPWFSYPMPPGALGHEAWGTIDSIGAGVTALAVGDRVASLAQSSYAEFDIARESAVIRLPHILNGRPFPGEPLGCAINIFQRSGIKSGDSVAIVGVGFLGVLLCRLAAAAGAHVIAIGRRPFALTLARDAGAEAVLPLTENWEVVEHVKTMTDGKMCDVVVEAVGKQSPLDLASELTKEMGRLVIAGYHQDGLRQVNLQIWNWRGLDVINAHEREEQKYVSGICNAASAVADGLLPIDNLLTHRFPLARLGEALALTRDRPDGFMKALVILDRSL